MIESQVNSNNDDAVEHCPKLMPLTFDEVETIIKSGDSKKLREVIETGRVSDVNMRNTENLRSLLMFACINGLIKCAKVLLDHKADINYRICSDTVLKCACLSGNLDMLALVLDRGAHISDFEIWFLLRLGDIVCNTAIATTLIGFIQNVNFMYDYQPILFTCICASSGGNIDAVKALIERGARCDLVSNMRDTLAITAGDGNLEAVKLFLHKDNTFSRMTQEGVRDAIESAARYGHIDVVKCLFEYGTDTSALNRALYNAVFDNHVDVAAFLFENGADFFATFTKHVWSPWAIVCRNDSSAMTRLLIEHGGNPNALDSKGESPLKAALEHPEILKVLLEYGANPDGPCVNGNTALVFLSRYKHDLYMQSITVLLEHGADPNIAHATKGATALMFAATALEVNLVKILLEYGADVTQVNSEGRSVLDMLGDEKYSEVRELCTQYIDCNKAGGKPVLK